ARARQREGRDPGADPRQRRAADRAGEMESAGDRAASVRAGPGAARGVRAHDRRPAAHMGGDLRCRAVGGERSPPGAAARAHMGRRRAPPRCAARGAAAAAPRGAGSARRRVAAGPSVRRHDVGTARARSPSRRAIEARARRGADPRGGLMSETLTPVKPGRLVIDGQSVDAASGATFTTMNPATEEPITTVAEAGPEDVDRAVRAARAALEGPWSKMKPIDRSRVLWKLGDLVLQHADELARLETLDNGKPIFESRYVDIDMVAR